MSKRTLKELTHELDTRKFFTRQEMRELMWDLREVAEELLERWVHLNNKINKVTAPCRHGNPVPEKAMTDLCNTQQEVWDVVDRLKGH